MQSTIAPPKMEVSQRQLAWTWVLAMTLILSISYTRWLARNVAFPAVTHQLCRKVCLKSPDAQLDLGWQNRGGGVPAFHIPRILQVQLPHLAVSSLEKNMVGGGRSPSAIPSYHPEPNWAPWDFKNCHSQQLLFSYRGSKLGPKHPDPAHQKTSFGP